LKEGGRAAVVLPDGFLFGEGMKTRLKEKLLAECNLHTIVRLPNGVFNPYTGIKTNLLFFTKGRPTEQIWYYEHPYPEGYKSYSKTKPMRFAEFATEIDWWGEESDGFAARRGDRAGLEGRRSRRSRRATTTWISRTPTRASRSATTRRNCWPSTPSSRRKSRSCATSSRRSSAMR
jgi:type I restriction-modification system DNA methylase subunit